MARFAVELHAGVRGFMFDIDGTLAHRGLDGRAHAQPGAIDVLERIRASGRPLVLFTNASHVSSATVAAGLRADGLPVSDDELLTPVDSATSYLLLRHGDQPVQLFASDAVREHMTAAGVNVTGGDDAEVVFVAHQPQVDLDEVERAARAIERGASLLTSSYVRGYAGANGMILSRGAMITAAVAKAGGRRARVVGKPSRAAVDALRRRLGVPTKDIVVIGDDARMDIALGKLGGSQTILVRSGISADVQLEQLPPGQRPDVAITAIAELLPYL
ncbi:MAG TPA: HAD hydrolase-like protein [Solirubrobacteraceae bacterium]|nr:HAD hydrolase-like protein [Solirubrobacteraceae bacterium]